MKPPAAYKLLLSECTLPPTSVLTQLSFKINTSTSSKTVKPFSLGTRNQHLNCQILIFQSKEVVGIQFISSATLQPKQIHLNKQKQIVDLIDKSNQKQGSLTVEVENIKSQPEQKQRFYIKNIKIQFTLGMAPKKDLFLLIKQGDNHIRTQLSQVKDQIICQWKQQHEFDPEEPHQNIYVECWQGEDEYVGTSAVSISKGMNKLAKFALKDIKDDEIGMVCLKIYDQQNFRKEVQKSALIMRPLKIYILEAVLNKELNGKTHTYLNLYLQGNQNKLSTTSVFSQDRNPKWNQSFQLMIRQEQYLRFQLCQKSNNEEEEMILAVGSIQTLELQDSKKEIHLQSKGGQVGKLYIEVQSKQSKKQEHKSPPSKLLTTNNHKKPEEKQKQIIQQKKIFQPTQKSPKAKDSLKQPQPPSSRSSKFGNSQTLQQLKQMKAKYTGKTMYQYYNDEMNEALRQGLLMVAKEKPSDPIRQLGLFLMNYKR